MSEVGEGPNTAGQPRMDTDGGGGFNPPMSRAGRSKIRVYPCSSVVESPDFGFGEACGG